jgi:hypothetical protein
MQIFVLVERVDGNGYRARSGEPLAVSAEGATPDEAVSKVRDLITARLAGGSSLVPIDLPGLAHPWARGAGMFKDDPLFDEWQQAIAERRRQMDEDPEVP